MCGHCGCAAEGGSVNAHRKGAHERSDRGGSHSHHHAHHDHAHHDHGHHDHAAGAEAEHAHVEMHQHTEDADVLHLGRQVLDKNARLAERVRGILLAKGICALNLVSSPGSGKTALLERTARDLGLRAAVLVGDLATDRDAERLRTAGLQAVQITTGNVCHLDAHMILHGLERVDLAALDVLFFENVGNLVCPASFDLGEDHRVVLSSVTEGEDKPRKYPTIFQGVDLALITKTDLAEAVDCDLPALRASITDVAPAARILELSAKSAVGLEAWLEFVRSAAEAKRAVAL